MTFLGIGEQNEDETDINTKDIQCLMRQMKVDRNTAVKALKLHSNTIDAILSLGNKYF
jgi:NACalpha-BTF3-like transcription factor